MKEVTVTALYSNHDNFLAYLNNGSEMNSVSIGKTHFPLAKFTAKFGDDYPTPAILEDAFDLFNWHGGSAPAEVNALAKKYDTHVSLTAGDACIFQVGTIVEIWVCKRKGWSCLSSFDMAETYAIEVP